MLERPRASYRPEPAHHHIRWVFANGLLDGHASPAATCSGFARTTKRDELRATIMKAHRVRCWRDQRVAVLNAGLKPSHRRSGPFGVDADGRFNRPCCWAMGRRAPVTASQSPDRVQVAERPGALVG